MHVPLQPLELHVLLVRVRLPASEFLPDSAARLKMQEQRSLSLPREQVWQVAPAAALLAPLSLFNTYAPPLPPL